MNTFRKLADGTWGIMCDGPAKAGDTVTVTLRDGRTKSETLGERVGSWRDSGIFTVVKTRKPLATARVGSMASVLALFAKAKTHLKYPAIVLSVPEADMTLRLSVAGPRAKVPGSITVLTAERNGDGGRAWIGRIHTDGTFEISPRVNGKEGTITARLEAFAADPAKVAAEHGHLTGACCFCNKALTDERSTEVGYGPVCAGHFDLPWGKK